MSGIVREKRDRPTLKKAFVQSQKSDEPRTDPGEGESVKADLKEI
jgi:hypothetical protein